jgi:hypothetical protein
VLEQEGKECEEILRSRERYRKYVGKPFVVGN